MAQLRIALVQADFTVGDIPGNVDLALERCREAAEQGAHLVALPEMALTGYPIEDLALRSSFVAASRRALGDLAGRLDAAGLGDLAVIVGYLGHHDDQREELGRPKGAPQNAAAVLHDGKVRSTYAKHHLPNYGVFDEARYFVSGDAMQVVRIRGVDVAFCICEDLWRDGPTMTARSADAGLLVVINGSPYERNKDDTRLELCASRAVEAGCALAYVNLVGGQDELVFDGDSIVVDAAGAVVARAPQFEEALLVVDLDLPAAAPDTTVAPAESSYEGLRIEGTVISREPVPAYEAKPGVVTPRITDEEEVWSALVTGLRGYVRKNGFRSVTLGLSGGIDSAVVAVIAADAIGADNVSCVSMPSRYSSDHSKDDAADLAERTGVAYRVVPIHDMVQAFLEPLKLTGLSEENLQARCRGVVLMGLSNEHGHLVLAPGNKSELSVGYSTLYGDSVGGYAPIKDVPKTLVWDLARWRNAIAVERGETPPIPDSSISKPPSAELRPGQVDTDSLPDYELLDDILDDYVEQDSSSAQLVAHGFDKDTVEKVLRMVDVAEYKRRQYPPGPKISVRNFGRDRRLPITSGWREVASD
ncbi:MAG: NAD+ synthase [Propionibacteriales bacterium]|nr:NAD+ synthase [Propionibacteriales bacterium]